MSPSDRRALLTGLAFVSPWLAGFLLLTAYPLAASLWYSLCAFDGVSEPRYAGLENYRALWHDPLFWKSLANTLVFVALWIPSGLGVCLACAILLNQPVRGRAFFRTLFFLPSVTPLVAVSVVWLSVFQPLGLANALLEPAIHGVNVVLVAAGLPALGLPGWVNDPAWAKPALVLMTIWGMGNTILIFLAGLQDIPRSLYESAALDGAGAWHRLRHITLPMLSPVILFNVIIGLIAGFQVFTQSYVMTRGGPQDSTLFYAYHLFNNAFQFFDMGRAAAMAWLLFLLVLASTAAVLASSARWVYYGGDAR